MGDSERMISVPESLLVETYFGLDNIGLALDELAEMVDRNSPMTEPFSIRVLRLAIDGLLQRLGRTVNF